MIMLRILVLLAATLSASCMEMRETVERMVMVRTSGSDLQPAATGYIYKKKNDGEESVVKMGESEVMEHLSKYYEKPKSFKGTNKQSADIKDASKDERVIPVSEESEEKVDGLASDDFKKILEKYGVNFGDHEDYDHYSHGLPDFDDGHYYGYGGDGKDDKKAYGGYKNQHYGDGDVGDYHNEKYESFTHSHKGDGKEKDSNKHYDNKEHKQNTDDESKADHKRGHVRFQKAHDDDQKDRKYYDNGDGVKFAFYKYGDSKYYGDGGAYKHDGAHETGKVGESHHGANHSAEEQDDSDKQHHESDGGQIYSNSFGFKIKH